MKNHLHIYKIACITFENFENKEFEKTEESHVLETSSHYSEF